MKRVAFNRCAGLLTTCLLIPPAWQIPNSASTATAAPNSQDEAAPPLGRAAMEEFLKTAAIVRTRYTGKGQTSSLRATLSNGQITHDAHIQSIDTSRFRYEGDRGTEYNFRDTYKFNIAAYLLDKMLGLNRVPVSVERKVRGRKAAVTWWIDGVMMDESQRRKKKIEPPDLAHWNGQVHIVRVFDALIYNADRNLENLLITNDWKLWMIDHTRAFRIQRNLPDEDFLLRCERNLLERLRSLSGKEVERALGPYLKKGEIKALLYRRDKIVQLFDEQISRKGETAVLYTLP